VTWIWKTEDTPHTVTFLAGQPAPDVVVPQTQPGAPPALQLNPQVLAPAGNATNWDGGTFLNSGFLQPMPGKPTPTFTVRFTNPGQYDYVCVLHEGMVGTVVVEPSES
jgi:plastocyanin